MWIYFLTLSPPPLSWGKLCFLINRFSTPPFPVQVRALQHPPIGVKLVIEAVCIMKEVKPKKVAGEKLGVKVDDYWDPGKALLQDPTKFLESLFKFDKESIPDQVSTVSLL